MAQATAAGSAAASGSTAAFPAGPLAATAESPSDAALQRQLQQARIDNQKWQAAYYKKQASAAESGSPPPWLQTLLGGLVALAGGIVTAWWTGRLADRKTEREQQRVHHRHRGQLRLAARELLAVLERIPAAGAVPPYLCEQVLYATPARPQVADRNDVYYLKYDLVDGIYRFCALLGWLELYRTDTGFLRGSEDETTRLERAFASIRADLAAPRPVGPDMPAPVRDGFVLEDDQRAIGEKMLTPQRTAAAVIGYAAFCEGLFRDPQPPQPAPTAAPRRGVFDRAAAVLLDLWRRRGTAATASAKAAEPIDQNWWIRNATRFFVELQPAPGTDLKRDRIADLKVHLNDLVEILA